MSDKPNDADFAPKDWGDDPLGKFLNDAHYNTVATFINLRPQYEALAAIDRLYCKLIPNLSQSSELVAGFFLFRTHSSFRGAVHLCLSGQIPEAYMVLRGGLESALYGLYAAGDTNRQEVWLRRHIDDESMRLVKSTFSIRNVLNHLQSIDARTHDIAKALYEQTIDLGGHPNERAVMGQIKTESIDSRVVVTADYFLCGNLPHQVSLKTATQISICCLDIFSSVFRDQYRILGIVRRLDQIRRGF